MIRSNLVHILTEEPSIASQFISELRNVEVQRDSMRFRRNLERLGEVLAYKISTQLTYAPQQIQTPLASCEQQQLTDYPVLATVLRAGLPFHQGFLNYFDQSPSAFVAAYRLEATSEITVNVDYLAGPSLEERVLLLVDPMLATGTSLALTYKAMLRFGTPREVHIAAAIASPEGVKHIQEQLPEAILWLGALDDHLNERAYIVPGLGDAGDLAFGSKI
ncbi:uracil phosphoribosyltransferase [Adhaeribacter pallidiroseus]|uniref:Uracil phosphoribosyltransferase n=1 Tax=Adhaeribacter pallidiroseus TaxID=2072847 RepID=A0A369QGP1_9BACT|nr:uracil phosphoribosyltransferase [Adhaeribacter pallidiroseus]RDC61458.1 Uracil phosphoribosyltransferase [Adhaeribacter pallidiroseus]